MVCASRRVRTRLSRRSRARCWDRADWLKPDQPHQLADRLLAVDQLAQDQQPVLVAHRLEQGASLPRVVLQLSLGSLLAPATRSRGTGAARMPWELDIRLARPVMNLVGGVRNMQLVCGAGCRPR